MGSGDLAESQKLAQCRVLLNRLRRNSNAGPFLNPVDPVALGIPDYFEKIKNPMDLSTIRAKLESSEYRNAQEFDDDMQLMFRNCFEYNAPGTPVNEMGRTLKSIYDALFRQLTASVSNVALKVPVENERLSVLHAISLEEADMCADVINSLSKVKHRKYNWPFLAPVTEEEAPGYFSIITEPMDLSTARKKLEKGSYQTVTEFISDILLIFKNYRIYNAEETEVYKCGQELEKIAKSLIAEHLEEELRAVELKEQLELSHQELAKLELEAMEGSGEVFGIALREGLAEALMEVSKEQAHRVAELLYENEAYEAIDSNELEVNLYTAPDEVCKAISQYLQESSAVDNPQKDTNV